MKFDQKGLPIPAWLIAVMFVVGIGVGLGIAITLSVVGQKSASDGIRPWDDERAQVLLDNSNSLPDANKAKPKTQVDLNNVDRNDVDSNDVDSEEVMQPNVKDYRWLKNITKGPVKRAIKNAIDKITPDIKGCVSFNAPKDVISELEFEAIGGMATLVKIDSYLKPSLQTSFDLCVIKKVGERLIDFPVEDGGYKVLFRFSKNDPKKQQQKP